MTLSHQFSLEVWKLKMKEEKPDFMVKYAIRFLWPLEASKIPKICQAFVATILFNFCC